MPGNGRNVTGDKLQVFPVSCPLFPVSFPLPSFIFLLAIIAGLFILRSQFLSVPFERDEGAYAAIAQGMLRGELPYRDLLDTKPPVTFFLYALAFCIFGQTPFSAHLLALIFVCFEVIAVYLVARRISTRIGALAGAALFAVSSSLPGVHGFVANNEVFMIFFTLLGLLFFLRAQGQSRLWLLLAGAASAWAFLTKPPAAADFLGLAVLVLILRVQSGKPKVARAIGMDWLVLLMGFALGAAPIVGYLLANGIFGEFLDAVFVYNLSYVARIPAALAPKFFWATFSRIIRYDFVLWGLGALGLVVCLVKRFPLRALVPVTVLFAALGVTLSFQFYPHYFIQILPPLAISAALGVAAVAEVLSKGFGERRRPFALGAALVSILLGIGFPLWLNRSFFTMDERGILLRVFPGNPFAVSPEIGAYIAAHSSPADRVFIFGSEPQILFYARRRSASRYMVMYPLNVAADALKRQESVVKEIEANSPAYVVFVDIAMSHLFRRGVSPPLLLHELERLLEDHYAQEAASTPSGKEVTSSQAPFAPIRIYVRKR